MLTSILWWTLLMLLWLLFIGYQVRNAIFGKYHRNKFYFFRNDPIYGVTGKQFLLKNDKQLPILRKELQYSLIKPECLSLN